MPTAISISVPSARVVLERAVWTALEDLTLSMSSLESKYIDSKERPAEIRAIYKEFLDNKIQAGEVREKLFALIA